MAIVLKFPRFRINFVFFYEKQKIFRNDKWGGNRKFIFCNGAVDYNLNLKIIMAKKRVRHHVNPLSDLTEYSFSGFENDNPVIIDVGADHGEFTEGLLDKFGEEKNFIVFEIRKPLAEKLRQMFSDHKNVVVFDGDANRNFENIVRPYLKKNKVEEIFVNFPDPWFKSRHHKRRFINENFCSQLKIGCRVLRRGFFKLIKKSFLRILWRF